MQVLPPPTAGGMVAVVSGLPRSGTSLLMRALDAGGLQALTDGERSGDSRNPHGYFELEAVKSANDYRGWIGSARGKVVKVVSRQLSRLPPTQRYDVMFVRRDMQAILRSQRDMASHHAEASWDEHAVSELGGIYQVHVEECLAWLRLRPNVRLHEIWYEDMLSSPESVFAGLAVFLEPRRLQTAAMVACVDPSLNHARLSAEQPNV